MVDTWERLGEVVSIQESVLEVYSGDESLRVVFHDAGVLCACRVSIPQEDISQPIGNDGLLIHQVPDALQYGFEIVLLQGKKVISVTTLESNLYSQKVLPNLLACSGNSLLE